MIQIKQYPDADAVHIRFKETKWAYDKRLDDRRSIEYDHLNEIRGITFLCVSDGIDSDDMDLVPTEYRDEVMARLDHCGIKVPA